MKTRDEAEAEILARFPRWAAGDLRDFLDATPQEQTLMIQAYNTSGIVAGRSAWETVLTIITPVLALAGAVSGVSGGVQALVKLGQLL